MENKYAFLMINYDTPDFIKKLQNKIDKKDICDNNPMHIGIENETHVTLVPCLDNDVDLDKIKEMLMPLNKYEIILTDISCFKNKDYDVLKCNAFSNNLLETNKLITSKFDIHTEFKDYTPHLTIAYLNKGTAEKYIKNNLNDVVLLKPKYFKFSYYENDEEKYKIFY